MNAVTLQKLVYYSQAWSLVWDGALFSDEIQAWRDGPVAPALYEEHRGASTVAAVPGEPDRLSDEQKAHVREVYDFYGHRDQWWLSELTHREAPWRDARGELPEGAGSDVVITHDAMRSYYSSLHVPRGKLTKELARGLALMMDVSRDDLPLLLSKESAPIDDVDAFLADALGGKWEPSRG